MSLSISDLLTADEVKAIRAEIADATFVDGRATAGKSAGLVKLNEQIAADDKRHQPLMRRLHTKIVENKVFRHAALPRALRPMMISRYRPGMEYGTHVDNPIMGDMRTDLSFTLFLSDPGDYDGGELMLEGMGGREQAIKLPAGSMILYASGELHRVAPVTRGERLAAVGWAQSLVRDPRQREILYDLETLRMGMFDKDGKTPAFDALSKCVSNLMRMWAEP
jgi:PKHD-type hydroxylase